jgi:hypothetical protein
MQLENRETDFSDSTKPTWTYAKEENAANEKAENLKTCLPKKYWPNTLLWKVPPLKNSFEFMSQTQNQLCESKTYLVLLFGSAPQRLALAADGGRVSEMLVNPKTAEALDSLWETADSPPSAARCVVRSKAQRPAGWKKDYAPDRLD